MTITSTPQTELVAEYYDKFLLDNLYPDLYFYQFGDKKRVPGGMGKVVHWTRYDKIPVSRTAALVEGTALYQSGMSASRVSATLAGLGIVVKHSDFIIMTGISDVVTDSIYEASKAMALKMDNVTRGAISAAGSIWGGSHHKGTVVGVTCTTPLIAANVIQVATKLRKANAKTFPDGNFVGIAHPNPIHDLQTDSTTGAWLDVNKYATNETVGKLYRGEVGKMYGVRFLMSSDIPKLCTAAAATGVNGFSSSGGSGYNTFIFGPGAYGVVELDGGGAKTFVKQLGSAGTSDTLNQIATVGVKVYWAAADLDCTNRLYRVSSGSGNI
jgi:N4-gp56 family major capsid protein